MFMFNEQIETLPIDELRKLQNERLVAQVQRLYNNVPYYKNLFDENNLTPSDIKGLEDLHKIPFTKKVALRDEYPFGLFATPRTEISRLHCSSGTTGKPIVVGYTKNDIEIFSEVVARSLAAAGCRPGMVMQNAYGYGLFTGGLGIHYGAEKLGMTVLPISGGGTEKQITLMQDFQSEVLCATPSYALTLAETIHKQGIPLSSLNLKYAVLGAEPWTDAIREEIERKLGVKATNIYGLSEIIGPGVSQEDVDEKGTGSYIWEDHFYPEIVDKDTGEPLPYGEQGVLVFTTLTKEGMPLLRYWTNDITSLSYEQSNKRTFVKMAPIAGRADDMLIIRGVNLFPSQIEAVMEKIPELSLNYQVVLTKSGTMDEVEVKVDLQDQVYHDIAALSDTPLSHEKAIAITNTFKHHIKTDIGLSMKICITAPGTCPRSEGGKINRVLDLRSK